MKALKKKLEAELLAKFESKLFQYAPACSWHIKLQSDRQRRTFSTKKTNRAEAAKVAKEIYEHLQEHGMAKTIEEYDPEPKAGAVVTIGDLIKKVEGVWLNQSRTLHDYIRDLRRVIAEVKGVSRENADKVRIADISHADIETWRVSYIKAAGASHAKKAAAQTSSNSILRGCKALFGKKLLKQLQLTELPKPFAEIQLPNNRDHRFKSPSIKASALLTKAAAELGTTDPEAFKVVLLTLCLGLRRNECDKLEWTAFNFDAATLHIGKTDYLHPKSEKSVGTLEVEPEVLELFRGWKVKAISEFVLESGNAPRMDASYAHYRCVETFDRLTKWLRANGIDSHSPIHDLRKMFGSAINDNFGLHAASLALRHSDVAITASHYLSKREGVVSGLGAVLATPDENVIPITRAAKKPVRLKKGG
jgi:integrase